MKKHFLFYLFGIIHTALMAQITTGQVKWERGVVTNYIYTGELLNGKPDGIGLAISVGRGDSIIFGRFKNGMMEGGSVISYNEGALIVGSFKENEIHGMAVVEHSQEYFSYCNYINGIMNGKMILIKPNNQISIGDVYDGEFNGRKILIPAEGLILYDNMCSNNKKAGPGYIYELANKQMFEGIWENDIWVRATTGNYPSFMRSRKFGSSRTDDIIMIYSALEPVSKAIRDTCFVYDLENDRRYFGYFENGNLKSGIMTDGDDYRSIGAWDENGNKGYCINYKKGYYLNSGNYRNNQMNGEGVSVDLKDSTIYIGTFSNGNFTGTGVLLTKNKEIRIGNFNNGKMDGEGKIIFRDGRSISGIYNKGRLTKVKEVINPDGKKNEINPKDISTAINFLLKEWENNFMNISSGEMSEINPGKYESWYSISGGSSIVRPAIKGIDGKPHNEFSAEIIRDADYVSLRKKYDDLCKKISVCTITSLAKGKSFKLISKLNKLPEDGMFERIASFFTLPAYPGKISDPQIRVMVESNSDGYRLTVDLMSKWK